MKNTKKIQIKCLTAAQVGSGILTLVCLHLLSCQTATTSSSQTPQINKVENAEMKDLETKSTSLEKLEHPITGKTTWLSVPESITELSAAREYFKSINGFKLVFWGASWCPPCNELKAQVFNQDTFQELTENMTRIYIDGDSSNAQLISEALGVSGYPTLLILNRQGKESARIQESISLDEFKDIFLAATASDKPLSDRVAAAIDGKADNDDWKILGLTRFEMEKMGLASNQEQGVDLLLRLVKAAPENQQKPKIQLLISAVTQASKLGNFQEIAASQEVDAKTLERKRILQETAVLLAQELPTIFNDESILIASRTFINYEWKTASDLLSMAPSKNSQALLAEWLEASKRLAQKKNLSIDTRLWTLYPRILAAQSQKIPDSLRLEVIERVNSAMTELQTPYDHKAVVTGAAYLLRSINEHDRAVELLQIELQKTDSKFYVYSSLASLEKSRNNETKALEYSALARQNSTGRATKFQWMTSDLLLALKLKRKPSEVTPLLSNTYSTLFEIGDGFRGRNYARVQSIESAIKKETNRSEFLPLFAEFKNKCQSLDKESAMRCTTHFIEVTK